MALRPKLALPVGSASTYTHCTAVCDRTGTCSLTHPAAPVGDGIHPISRAMDPVLSTG
jgi:hypothetical protein